MKLADLVLGEVKLKMNPNYYLEVEEKIKAGIYEIRQHTSGYSEVWKIFCLIYNENKDRINDLAICMKCKKLYNYSRYNLYALKQHICFIRSMENNPLVRPAKEQREEILTNINTGVYKVVMETKRKTNFVVWKMFGRIVNEKGVMLKYAYCPECKDVLSILNGSSYELLRHKCFLQSNLSTVKHQNPHIGEQDKDQTTTAQDEIERQNMAAIINKIHKGVYKLTMKQHEKNSVWNFFALITREDGTNLTEYVFCLKCKQICKTEHPNLRNHKCFRKSQKKNNMNKIVEDNIKSGIYKLKDNHLSKSKISSRFALILKTNNSIIEDMVFCRQCKMVLEYDKQDEFNLGLHKCRSTAKVRAKLSSDETPNVSPSSNMNEKNKSKAEISDKLSKGIYKFKMRENLLNSPVWKTYAVIIKEDDTIIDNYVYCMKCKIIITHCGRKGATYGHSCYLIEKRKEGACRIAEENIKTGIYKLQDNHFTKSPIWTTFARILNDDDTIINGMVCCRQCKMVLKYSDQNDEVNLSLHKCPIILERERVDEIMYKTKILNNINKLTENAEESATVSNNRKKYVTIIQSSESNSADLSDSDESEHINFNFEQHYGNTNSTILSRFEQVSDDNGCIMNGVVCCCQCKMLLNYDGTTTIQLELHKCYTMASTLDAKIVEQSENNDDVNSPPKRMKPTTNPVNEQTDDSYSITENYSFPQNYPKFINELNDIQSHKTKSINEVEAQTLTVMQNLNNESYPIYIKKEIDEIDLHSSKTEELNTVEEENIDDIDMHSSKTKEIYEVVAPTLAVMPNLVNESYPIYIKKEIYDIDLHSSETKELNEVEEENNDDIVMHSSKTKEIIEVAEDNIGNVDIHSSKTKEINEVEEQPLVAESNLSNASYPNYIKKEIDVIDIHSNTTKEPLAAITNLTNKSSYSVYIKNDNCDSLCNESQNLLNPEDKEETINICTQFCIEEFVAPSVVEGLGFCKLIKYCLQHGAKYNEGNLDVEHALTNSMTIARHIQQETEAQRKLVESTIKEISDKIVISIDTWTDYIAKRIFFSFTLHFLKDCNLNELVLEAKSVDVPQNTEKIIQNKLENLLCKWGIDSLKNVVLVTEAISYAGKSWGGVCTLLKCSTYLFENVLNSAFENTTELSDIIRCCNVILKYFKETNRLAIKNANHCKINHYSRLKLITLNWTDINELLLTNNKEKLKISDASLSQLQNIIKLCRKFELIFKHLQATSKPSLCFVIPSIQRLQMLSDTNSNDAPEIMALKLNLLKYLQEIWLNNISIWHKAGCFLYPPANQQQEKDLNEIKDFCLKQMKDLTPIQTEDNDNYPSNTTDKADITLKETDDFDFFFPNLNKPVDATNQPTNSKAAEEEINCYCREKIMIHQNFNALHWWSHNSTKYPLLSRLALHILSIPASSKGSKRFLSVATNLINENTKTLDSIVFLNSITQNKS